jgi:hypothetical protein
MARFVGLAAIVGACQRGARTPVPPVPAPTTPPKAAPATADSVADRPTPPVKDSVAKPDSARRPAPADSAKPADAVKAAPKKKAPPATKNCLLDLADSPPETRMLYQRISEGVSNTFVGGGFVGRCQGENNRLRADSAEQFEAAGIVNLYGNVTYEEPQKIQIRSAHAIYFTREGRLYADGDVIATQLATGSTFSGPSIEYYRATAERPTSTMIAPQRSTVSLIEKDSAGTASPPTTVMANRFEERGDSLLYGWGDVLIVRERLTGRADSSVFDKATEQSRLVRGARIVNNDSSRRFTLLGDTIDLYSQARKLDRVIARHASRATTADMELDAETIDLRLKDQQLTEAFAFGKGRARAKTPQQDVDADSLRIRMAEKVVREVHAIGGARAMGVPDTTKMRTTERDLLRGDSIFAFFDSSAAAVRDTITGPDIQEIRAVGNASSLFHVPSRKGPEAKPAINYVRGIRIFVNFDTGMVADVRVDSAASGVFIEPEDSVVVVVDTSVAARDSAAARAKTAPKGKPAAPAKPPVPTPRPPSSPVPIELASLAPSSFPTSRRRP